MRAPRPTTSRSRSRRRSSPARSRPGACFARSTSPSSSRCRDAGPRGPAAPRGPRPRLVRAEPRRSGADARARRAPRGVPRPRRAREPRDRDRDAEDVARRLWPPSKRRSVRSARRRASSSREHAGQQVLQLARKWLHANHAFHDVIYSAAEVPLIERMAKAARRTFLVKPCGRPAPISTSCTRRTTAAPRDPRGDLPPAARRVLAFSRASTSSRRAGSSRRSWTRSRARPASRRARSATRRRPRSLSGRA